jgi:hypothetical protein
MPPFPSSTRPVRTLRAYIKMHGSAYLHDAAILSPRRDAHAPDLPRQHPACLLEFRPLGRPLNFCLLT